MKNTTASVFLTFLLIFIIISCKQISFDVSKRKYRPGYFVNLSSGKSKAQEKKNKSGNKIDEPKSLRPEMKASESAEISTKRKKNTNTQTSINKKNLSGPVTTNSYANTQNTGSLGNLDRKNQLTSSDNERPKSNSNGRKFLWLSSLVGVITFGLCFSSQKQMKKVSHWAKENKVKSRVLIGGTHTVLGVSGFVAGSMLADHSFIISETAKNVLISCFLASAVAYPVKSSSKGFFSHSYMRQKFTDLSLAYTGFLLIVTAGNQVLPEKPGIGGSPIHASSIVSNLAYELTQTIKENVKLFPSDSSEVKYKHSGIEQFLLILLAAVLFFGLLFFLAGLACSLSCNGNEAAAAIVFIAGLILLVYLFIIAIKGITAKVESK